MLVVASDGFYYFCIVNSACFSDLHFNFAIFQASVNMSDFFLSHWQTSENTCMIWSLYERSKFFIFFFSQLACLEISSSCHGGANANDLSALNNLCRNISVPKKLRRVC